jgi:YesN/AraC family two-component response regulator
MRVRRVLCVDDEEIIRLTMKAILERHGFEVVTAATVSEALHRITSEKFDVLLSDLNIGNPADGLTVVSAMRRTQPEAVTMILTGYPAFETALEAIRQQVDDYIVKPANVPALLRAIESKLATPPKQRQLPPPKRVAMVLQEHTERIAELWIEAVEQQEAPTHAHPEREQRLECVRNLLQEVIRASQSYHTGPESTLQVNPGRLYADGSTIATMLAEIRLLRRYLSQVVEENLLAVNLSYLVPDLARVNECLDDQALAALEALA